MVRIYTLTLAPSLDSATITPQIYPEGKLRCTAPYSNPEAAASTSPAPLPILEAVPQRSSRRVVRPANIWFHCWQMKMSPSLL